MSSDPVAPTHPFISFELDLTRLTHHDWMLLGEACSKVGHVANVPLQPATAQALHTLSLVKGARATTAIEGNTLSEHQVMAIVEKRLELPPSKQYLQREVQNVVDACNLVLDGCRDGHPPRIDDAWIKAQNALVLRGLEHHVEEGVVPGEWRNTVVGVSRYRAPAPAHVPELMRRLATWLDAMVGAVDDPSLRPPVELLRAIVGHLYLAWIHPFGDGNGRTARLLEFALLLSAGVPSASAHVLSNHYNETRAAYYRELDRASRTGDPYGFIRYSLQGFVDGVREQIATIQEQQLLVTWRDFVYRELGPTSVTHERRARLAIALAGYPDGVRTRDLLALTPELTRAYGRKTPKTLTRDVNALRELDLLVNHRGAWVANVDKVRAFRSFSTDAAPWAARSAQGGASTFP